MRKVFDVLIGILNLIVGAWLIHWSMAFWRNLRAGENGATQAALMLITAMSLDRFRVALQFLTGPQSNGRLFERGLRLFNLGLIIASLTNLYQQQGEEIE